MVRPRRCRLARRRKMEKKHKAKQAAARRWLKSLEVLEALDAARTPFRLLDLPGELRNRVYREALVHRAAGGPGGRYPAGLAPPPLTRTCRRVRAESLPIFYGENRFVLDADVDQCLRTACGRDSAGPDLAAALAASAGVLALVGSLRVRPGWYAGEKWGFVMSAVSLAGRAEDDRIGHGGLDWGSREAVEEAYLDTLSKTSSPTESSRVRWWRRRAGVRSMGTLLWTVAQACPQITRWVYITDY